MKTEQLLTVAFTLSVLIATRPVHGQEKNTGSEEADRQKFETTLRWKLSAGDPSGNTKIEISGNHIRITLTGSQLWNEATAELNAKYFGLLCLLWDVAAQNEDPVHHVLSDSFDVALSQEVDGKTVARPIIKRADFATLAELDAAIQLTKSRVRPNCPSDRSWTQFRRISRDRRWPERLELILARFSPVRYHALGQNSMLVDTKPLIERC